MNTENIILIVVTGIVLTGFALLFLLTNYEYNKICNSFDGELAQFTSKCYLEENNRLTSYLILFFHGEPKLTRYYGK